MQVQTTDRDHFLVFFHAPVKASGTSLMSLQVEPRRLWHDMAGTVKRTDNQ
jgi:hypothetical protein